MFTEKTSILIAAGLMISLSTNANTLQTPKPAPKPSPTTEINQTVSSKSLEQRPEQPETFEHWQSLKRWKEKSFVGNTRYELYKESAASERNTVQSGTTVLKATAVNSASVLYRQEAVDLTSTPWLEWSWKIESTYDDIDEKTKTGDDFPARLYVTAQTGLLPWESLAINYVWSSNSPIDSFWFSPYTKNSIMVAVQGGDSLVGQWVNQRRNVTEDFKDLFNIEVKKLSGFAVMVDGDNSSQSGTAYFGNIDFVAN